MGRALRAGVLSGVVAGVLFAAWSMAALWVTGSGLWMPLNLIAHTFYRSAPLDGTFSAPALVIGLAVHMTVAIIFGVAIAVIAQRMPASRSLVIAGGIIFLAAIWPIMQYGVWYQLDEQAAEGFNDWIFAGAHLIFGLTAAGMAAISIADDKYTNRGRHAAGRRPPVRSQPPPGSLFQPNRRR
jgi:hypothetical protein